MNNQSSIFVDHSTNCVVVTDEFGAEVFRNSKTEQNLSLANTFYMYHKYHAKDNHNSDAIEQ